MNKTEVAEKFSRGFHKFGLQFKKHSPAILIGAGIVGVVASTVLACKATTKLDSVVKESKERVERIHQCEEQGVIPETGEKYTEKQCKKDLTIVYAQTGMKLVKLYAPSILLGAVSITSIVASHGILNKRNAAISAAYMAVDKGFKNYRKNVKDRFGDKVDFELRHNVKAEQVETIEKDEKGKEKIKKETVEVAHVNNEQYSANAIIFDQANPNWKKDAEYNKMFLLRVQDYMNDRLRRQGYLFLNDVFDAIDHPRTKAGQVIGWVYDEKNPVGDNFVDFGIFDVTKPAARDFVNGFEKCIILDFNVDGPILELLPKYSRF